MLSVNNVTCSPPNHYDWTNLDLLSIGPSRSNFNKFWIKYNNFLSSKSIKNNKYGHFLSRRWIWKWYLQNVSHFIQAPMCKLTEAEWRIYVGSDNGLLPGQHQVIIWTSAEILLIELLVANFSEIFFKIHIFSFKKICISTGRLQNGSHFVSASMCSCR